MDRQVLACAATPSRPRPPRPARFSIESRPPGAEVTIDGKASGVTPLSADVGAGSHQITVRAAATSRRNATSTSTAA